MDPAEIDVPHAVVRVLEEAGIQFVFGMPGGDTGRIFDALYGSTRIRTILVRHEQVGSIMAEMYGRLTGKPGVVMGQGIFLACNALFGTLEAVKGASPMLLLADFTDMAPFQHHAPYQAGTGEHGNHDLRNLLASATKYTAAVYEPKQAMQTIQLAIKHATTGTPGPVAVVFGSRSLQGTVKTQRPPRVHATDRVLAPNVLRPAAADVARVAEMLLASSSPVILAGNGVHASRAWSELTALADLLAIPVATTATGKSAIADVHPQALGVFGNWGPGRRQRGGVDRGHRARRRLAPGAHRHLLREPRAARRRSPEIPPDRCGRAQRRTALPGGGRARRGCPRGAGRARRRAHAAAHVSEARRHGAAPRSRRRAQEPASVLRRTRAAIGRRPAEAGARDHRARTPAR